MMRYDALCCYIKTRRAKFFKCHTHSKGHWTLLRGLKKELECCLYNNPSIAQLVERRTVKERLQISLGHWFKSGSREFFYTKTIKMPLNTFGKTCKSLLYTNFYAECPNSSLHTHCQFINRRKFNKPDLLFVQWPNIVWDWGAFFNYVDKVLATYQARVDIREEISLSKGKFAYRRLFQ